MTSDEQTTGRRPDRRRRGLALAAVAGLLALGAAGCGTDSGDGDATADDTATASATTSASTSTSSSPSASTSESATPSTSPSASDEPVPSPVINKAVKGAIKAGFPALVPAGVPSGWTVQDATYSPQGGGTWTITLLDPNGAQVALRQTTQPLADNVASVYGGPQQPSGNVQVSGTGGWKVYAGDPAGIGKSLAGTSAVLTGPDQDTLLVLAEQLLTAEDGGAGTGDG